MKTLLLFLVLNIVIASQPSEPGPLSVGWTSTTLTRDGRTINTIIYYPALIEGSQSQIDTINGPYPIVALGHGFFMQNSYYISILKHLASYGYVVIAPQFPDNVHLQLGYDLLHCVNYIKQQNRNPSSIFNNLIDSSKVGLTGHSMGGGSSLLAASLDSTITVVAPLAAAETNPSVISKMKEIRGAVYLIAAQNDGITSVNQHQLPMYNNANPTKALVSIKGGNHTKFMDTRIWDWTDVNGYISAERQLSLTNRYLVSIYNLFLKGDSSYFKYAFGEEILNDTSIILQKQLKPLPPKSFNLLFPVDTLYSPSVGFNWNTTYSLNLLDTIKYELSVSLDSNFTQVVLKEADISDTFFVANIGEGNYYCRIKAYTSDSTSVISNVNYFAVVIPSKSEQTVNNTSSYKLYQNFPNPFNPSTKIGWVSPHNSWNTIKVYNSKGEEVYTLVNEYKDAGAYEVTFDIHRNRNLNSGVYFYQLIAGDYVSTRKMVLLK